MRPWGFSDVQDNITSSFSRIFLPYICLFAPQHRHPNILLYFSLFFPCQIYLINYVYLMPPLLLNPLQYGFLPHSFTAPANTPAPIPLTTPGTGLIAGKQTGQILPTTSAISHLPNFKSSLLVSKPYHFPA